MKNALPLLLKNIQYNKITTKKLHQVESKKLQTTQHTVREIYSRTSFFPKKHSDNVSGI